MMTFSTRVPLIPKRVLSALCYLAPGLFILLINIPAFCAPGLTLSSAGGITVAGNAGTLGNIDALGAGALSAGVSMIAPPAIPPITGTLYYSPINIKATGLNGGATGLLTAYASTNFSHSVAFVGYTCTSGCTSSASYTQLPANSASATTLAAAAANNSITEVWLGVFVTTTSGASGFSGADSVHITFSSTNSKNGMTGTQNFTLNITAQTAVGLWLGTAAGGLNFTSNTMNFGNVNGLGIAPAAGLTATSVPGSGYLYSTPYTITPIFAGFTTTTPCTVVVNGNFLPRTTYPNFYLEDSAAPAGPYSQITSPANITISSPAANKTGITRYLGLFVSNANGNSSVVFTGTPTSAILTYTLTAP